MADDAPVEDAQITFNVKAANDKKHVLTLPAATTVADLKTKLSSSEYADIPPERQRLIYSGRVLKDHDTLASTKIKDGHTVHLVKGAASNARQNPAATGSSTGGSTPAAAQVPTNIAAGTGNNPLAGLTGARYAGFHGLPGMDTFGPDGGMGGTDPNQLLQMMEDPNFLQQMNEAMDNPAVIEMMQNSPMVRNNPMVAEMLRNPELRRAMFNPEMMRMQLQMQRAMNQNGGGGSFPMPGATNTTPQNSTGAQDQSSNAASPNPAAADPFASLLGGGLGGGAGGANPFASLLGGANPWAPQQQNQGATPSTGTDANTSANTGTTGNSAGAQNTSTSPPPPGVNPFASLFGPPPTGTGAGAQPNPIAEMSRQMMQNPEMMRAAMQMMGGAGGNPFGQPPATAGDGSNPAQANPFAALMGGGGFGGGGFGAPAPQDNRPPEEVYENQLRQLNEMGFYEFERNVMALRRSGGNVQAAIEFLLGGGS
ncbi:Deubiquitination-protection protein dph1 [Paraphaeosphaeria sporulosa]